MSLPIRYAGEVDDDFEEVDDLVIDGLAEVIDLPLLRPEVERACQVVGSLIGIAAVYAIYGFILGGRALFRAARRLRT